MKRNLLIIIFISLSFIILSAGVAQAMSISASPDQLRSGGSCNTTLTLTGFATLPCGDFLVCDHLFNCAVYPFICATDPCVLVNPLPASFCLYPPGTYPWTVQSTASCANPPDPASYDITLLGCPELSITTSSTLPSGTVGQTYSQQILASGGEGSIMYALASGTTLPPGLSFSGAGLISGIPTTAGSYNFIIKATDTCSLGAQSVQKAFSIDITTPSPPPPSCPALNITTSPTLSSGTQGQAYSQQIQTSGGQAPVTYSLVSGTLPPGLSLSSTGFISGAPAATGSYSFTIRASDSCSSGTQTVQRTFNLTANPAASGTLSVTVMPSSFSIPKGTASTKTIIYTFAPAGSAMPGTSTQSVRMFSSDRGIFRSDGNVIGEINIPLTVSLTDLAGSISEAVNIPVSVIKRAEDLGTTRIFYTRIFTDGIISVTAQVEIIITTEAGAELRITRFQLYFENKRAEITIKKNQPPPRAYAEIRFTGAGFLRGFWEVDGRLLSNVFRHLVYGRTVIIETPDMPPLPTFEAGSHRIRFVITEPLQNIKLPEALYFVTSEEYQVKKLPINLITPEHTSEVEFSPATFRWEDTDGTTAYLIEFFEEAEEKPVFSAFTKNPEYTLPSSVLKSVFAPGKDYQWKVKGFDPDNNKKAESPVYRFVFIE